jgi:hypothetical protein
MHHDKIPEYGSRVDDRPGTDVAPGTKAGAGIYKCGWVNDGQPLHVAKTTNRRFARPIVLHTQDTQDGSLTGIHTQGIPDGPSTAFRARNCCILIQNVGHIIFEEFQQAEQHLREGIRTKEDNIFHKQESKRGKNARGTNFEAFSRIPKISGPKGRWLQM